MRDVSSRSGVPQRSRAREIHSVDPPGGFAPWFPDAGHPSAPVAPEPPIWRDSATTKRISKSTTTGP